MNITFIQTADPIFYDRMLSVTSRTVKTFCLIKGLRYESYVGIKRGTLPWQAAYNRAYMLKEMVDRGVDGWVFYLDADAYIHDIDFDIRGYLADKAHLAGIFLGYIDSELPYFINSGGFAINLSHTTGRALALAYWRSVEDISHISYNSALRWEIDIPDDQGLLHGLLLDYVEHRGMGSQFLFERHRTFVNHGEFIRQSIRAVFPDYLSRLRHIEQEVDVVMQGREDDRMVSGAGHYLPASHLRISTIVGRKDHGGIATTGQAGILVYGPYMPLKAGSYAVRVFGEARSARNGARIALEGDVYASDTTWSQLKNRFAGATTGVLLEHHVHFPVDQDRVEVRVMVDGNQDMIVHAVQIQRSS